VYRKVGHVRISRYSDSGYAGDMEIGSQLLGIVPLLGEILWLGVRSKMLYFARVQKLSIE